MSIVGRRYAQALMNLAARDKQVEPVGTALDELADAIASSAQLASLLDEPKVPLSAKEAVIGELVARTKVPALVATFVRYITGKRRIGLLADIRQAFHELADERMGRATALVTVAAPLTSQQEQALRERLARLSGKKEVKLSVQVDPQVLGGVVARIGSTVWDGSLRNQLNEIQQSILK